MCLHILLSLMQELGHGNTLSYEPWPEHNEAYLAEDAVKLPIQVCNNSACTPPVVFVCSGKIDAVCVVNLSSSRSGFLSHHAMEPCEVWQAESFAGVAALVKHALLDSSGKFTTSYRPTGRFQNLCDKCMVLADAVCPPELTSCLLRKHVQSFTHVDQHDPLSPPPPLKTPSRGRDAMGLSRASHNPRLPA